MRVRVGVVALLVAPWALVACGHENDAEDCPGQLSEEYLQSEAGQAYLRELEKLTGSTDGVNPAGDAYATYFTVTCDD